jgi:hypothetical protein
MASWPGRRYCGNSIASIVRIGIKRQTAGTTNIPKFALTTLLAFAAFAPAENAAAQNALGGAILGGTAGAIVGGAVGGGRGAAVGAIVGATTGAAIASQGQPRPGGYYYYDRGCYVQRPDGAWILVSPRYCG